MTWSYSGIPGKSPLDLTRFLIGDTNECDQLLQNGEIEYILSLYNNIAANAAIHCCDFIIGKFSRMADENVGQVKITYSQKAEGYRKFRRDLTNRLATVDMMPYAGGITISDETAVKSNTDRDPPYFSRHLLENWQISPWVSGVMTEGFWPGSGGAP